MPPHTRDGRTPLQQFRDRWGKGCGQEECSRAKRVVLCKGKVPCDILFVGEAPGASEDSLGVPFAGPAGHLLDEIIRRAIPTDPDPQDPAAVYFRLAYTNLVCCQPWDYATSSKALEPTVPQVEGCAQRLVEFVALCKPRVIVTVGSWAQEWLEPGYRYSVKVPREIPRVPIVHPAYLLRQNVMVRDMGVRKCVIALSDMVDKLSKSMENGG